MDNRAANSQFRWPVAIGVLCLHLIALAWLVEPGFGLGRDGPKHAETATAALTAFIVDETATQDKVPVPEVTLEVPTADLNSIRFIQFESGEWGDTSGIVAPASAPQLARFQPVGPSSFARRAGLAPGEGASVVLVVEVLRDGHTGSVELSRGCGHPAIDAAAVAYARLLRWIPGTRDHHAEVMRVNLPVTLIWRA
jgi:TonB family protein